MNSAFGLYTHIRANRWRSAALLVGLFAQVEVIAFAITLTVHAQDAAVPVAEIMARAAADQWIVAPIAGGVAVAWIAIAFCYNQSLINSVVRGDDAGGEDRPRLLRILETLCISRGLVTPRLRVIDSAALNAFASGLNAKQYTITLTKGLVDALDDREIEAVLAHELTHVRNEDVRLMVIAGVIANIIAFAAETMFRSMSRPKPTTSDDRSRSGGNGLVIVLAAGLVALAWITSQIIRLALSRSREYLADAGAVELTKNPDSMISALRKIDGRGDIKAANSAIMEMCLDNPRHGFTNLFGTHPSIDDRIDRLVRFAGGRDPGPFPVADASPEAPVDLRAADADLAEINPPGGPIAR